MIHELKTWPESFDAVAAELKTFEIRRDDRGFKVGDRLKLVRWDPQREEYTGESITVFVEYMIDLAQFGIPGFVAMQIVKEPTADEIRESMRGTDPAEWAASVQNEIGLAMSARKRGIFAGYEKAWAEARESTREICNIATSLAKRLREHGLTYEQVLALDDEE